MQIKAKPIK